MEVRVMRVLSVLCAVAASALALPGYAADQWHDTFTRGLHVYDVGTKTQGLRLVCDPDRVFGNQPNGTLLALMPKEVKPTTVALLAPSGESVRLSVTYLRPDDKMGWVDQYNSKAADWNKMVGMIQKGGKLAVVTAHDSFTLELAPFPDLRCD